MQLKKCADRSGANFAKMAILARLPFAYFLSYINILYIKSTHFWCRFQIQKKKLWFKVKNVKKVKFSFLTPFTWVCYVVKL